MVYWHEELFVYVSDILMDNFKKAITHGICQILIVLCLTASTADLM